MVGLIVGAVMILIGGLIEYAAWLGSQRRLLPGPGEQTERALRSLESAATGLGIAGGVLILGGLAVIVSGLDNAFGIIALVLSLLVATGSLAYGAISAARNTGPD